MTTQRNELGAPPGVWRLHEDAFAPDGAMVKEIEEVKCPGPGCKKWLPIDEIGDSTFCCTECFENYDKERVKNKRLEELHKLAEERCKTLKLMTKE